jgi:hypothetical protein
MTLARFIGSLGGLMQIVGVLLVLWEIADVERLFQLRPWHRSAADRLTAPLRRLGIGRRRQAAGVVVQVSGASLSIGGGRARVSIDYGPTLEGRIKTIEARLAEVGQDLAALTTRLTGHEGAITQRVAAVEESQREQIAAVRQLVKALSAGSILRRLWGAGLIVVGTALVTAALWLPGG